MTATTRTEPNAGGTITKTSTWGNTLAAHNTGKLRQALISGNHFARGQPCCHGYVLSVLNFTPNDGESPGRV